MIDFRSMHANYCDLINHIQNNLKMTILPSVTRYTIKDTKETLMGEEKFNHKIKTFFFRYMIAANHTHSKLSLSFAFILNNETATLFSYVLQPQKRRGRILKL